MEFDRLAEIIANALNKDPAQIQMDRTLKDLGADSLDVFQILYQIEDELQVRIDPADAEKLKTVGDLAKEVERISKAR